MKREYDIWYMKDFATTSTDMYRNIRPNFSELRNSHAFVYTCEARDLEHVFETMQAEVWSPEGEARPLIEKLGLEHTSMSIGDVAHDLLTNKWWVCDPVGWTMIGKGGLK